MQDLDQQARKFSHQLNLPIRTLVVIKKNCYCTIYRSDLEEQITPCDDNNIPICFIKMYRTDVQEMAAQEARALEFSSECCDKINRLEPCRLIAYNHDASLLAMSNIRGKAISHYLYRQFAKPSTAAIVESIGFRLGRLLSEFYERSRSVIATDGRERQSPLVTEYLHYVSEKLDNLHLLGHKANQGYAKTADWLVASIQGFESDISFCHGDFVLKNIHVDQLPDRKTPLLGVIDYGNANDHSHILSDICGFYFSVHQLCIPHRLRETLLESLVNGLQGMRFPDPLCRFYYEYHRRRWLWLKMPSRNPVTRIRLLKMMGPEVTDVENPLPPPLHQLCDSGKS